MSLITREGKANGHTMQGNEDYHTPLHFEMDAPISTPKTLFLETALENIFPDQTWNIVGAYWDYNHSNNEETRDRANGHYRVSVNGSDFVLCVNNHTDEGALRLGQDVYKALQEQGIHAHGIITLPLDTLSYEQEGLHIHLEKYNGGAQWLVQSKFDDGSQIPSKLGALAGKIYNTTQNLAPETHLDLEAYTDAVMYKYMRDGASFLKQPNAQQAIQAALSNHDNGDTVYTDMVSHTGDIIAIMERDNRVMQHGNMIEKMVAVDAKGDLHLMGPDCASYSYFPMMTENATYDVGTAVYRMLMNDQFYDGSPQEKHEKIIQALSEFVESYNQTTGLSLTVSEALDAAKQATTLLNAYEVGHYMANKDLTPAQTQEFGAHVKEVMISTKERIERIAMLKSIIPGKNSINPVSPQDPSVT